MHGWNEGKEKERGGIQKKAHWSKKLQMINTENIFFFFKVDFGTFSMRNFIPAIKTSTYGLTCA